MQESAKKVENLKKTVVCGIRRSFQGKVEIYIT